jgi:protein O-GlcNAc transferase
MPTIIEMCAAAIGHHQAGRLQEAERIYREILAVEPNYPQPWHLLGVMANQVGQHEVAVVCLKRALELKPDYAEAYCDLGTANQELRRRDEAITCYQKALEIKPDYGEAHYNLGNALQEIGKLDEAIDCYRRAAELKPGFAGVQNNLGLLLQRQGKLDEAVGCFRRATALEGEQPTFWLHLGMALYGQLRWAEAAEAFRRSLDLDPENANAWSNLGATEQVQNRMAEAEEAYQRSLALAPGELVTIANYSLVLIHRGDLERARQMLRSAAVGGEHSADEWVAVGNVHKALDERASAEQAYRRGLEAFPGHPQARQNLALVLESQWQYTEAEDLIRGILADNPESADAWSLLAGVKHAQAEHQAAIAASERSVKIAPDPVLHSRMLQFTQYAEGIEPEALLAAHRRWDEAYARSLLPAAPPEVAPGRTDERLRLGFLSADFGGHPIGFFALPTLEYLDKSRCFVACYSDLLIEDDYTARFRSAADLWRRTRGVADADLADQIRRDQIDVLVDLAGHHGKRLLVFARRPAALQLSWAGYVGTTGLAAMDGLIADRIHVPAGEEPYHCEAVLRMPHGYVSYGPPPDAPEVGPLPVAAAGHFTFGCFNNPAKYTSLILDAWAEILRRVPTGQLLLKFNGLDVADNRERISRQFAERGVDPGRIMLEGRSPHHELMATYGRVDLALDTQPYSGGVTTCEALWMGVPVVTFPGRTFAGRHATSHLTNAGFAEFVAADIEGYVAMAVGWTGRREELAVVRGQMRERMRRSPLCDARRFAGDFLAVVRNAWDQSGGRIGQTADKNV